MLEKELSVKGWNWGRAEFSGSTMSFEVGNHTAFEIPLSNVSQCTTGKNEVTLEFHQVGTIMTNNAADILPTALFSLKLE
jgi:structure-specific recognition protein 1